MKSFDCGRYVTWGLIAGLVAWAIFIATLIYASIYVPDVPTYHNQLFTQRSGLQAGGFIAGWWIAIAGFALCGIGYTREYKGLKCLLGVVPAGLYVANPWSVMVFVKFTAG
jgi:hypothetical protein